MYDIPFEFKTLVLSMFLSNRGEACEGDNYYGKMHVLAVQWIVPSLLHCFHLCNAQGLI